MGNIVEGIKYGGDKLSLFWGFLIKPLIINDKNTFIIKIIFGKEFYSSVRGQLTICDPYTC